MRSCIETYNMTMNDMNIARYYIDCTCIQYNIYIIMGPWQLHAAT